MFWFCRFNWSIGRVAVRDGVIVRGWVAGGWLFGERVCGLGLWICMWFGGVGLWGGSCVGVLPRAVFDLPEVTA